MRNILLTVLLAMTQLGFFIPVKAGADSQIHNHLTLDILPIAQSPGTPVGGGLGVSYDRYYDALKTSYVLGAEALTPYSDANVPGGRRVDVIADLGFSTEVTRAFAIGARIGVVVNQPGGPVGIGALLLRLPALIPEGKDFFSFFFEEADLGLAGAGERYASFRLGMLLY